MEAKPIQIFLSREGQTYGPITSEQLETMRTSGQLSHYAWVWNSARPGWIPSAPPPPPPGQPAAVAAAPTPPVFGDRAPTKPSRNVQVICTDGDVIISGTLNRLNAQGCILVSPQFAKGFSPFKKGARLGLNLLDEKASQSENIQAVLKNLRRDSTHWTYELSFKSPPALAPL